MSETLEYSVSVAGADQAGATLESLKVKQLQLASQAQQLARQISEAEKTAATASGQAAAEAAQKIDGLRTQLARVQIQSQQTGQEFGRLQQQTQIAGIGMADMASRTSDAIGRLAALSHEAAQHIQQMQGVSQGTRDVTAAIDENAQQVIRDTQQYGIFGIAVFGVRNSLRELEYQFGQTTERAAISAERIGQFANRIQGEVDAQALRQRLMSGQGTPEEYARALRDASSRHAAVTVIESSGDRAQGTSSVETGIELDMLQRGQRMAQFTREQNDYGDAQLEDNLSQTRRRGGRGGGSFDGLAEARERERAVIEDIKSRAAERAETILALSRQQYAQEQQLREENEQKQIEDYRRQSDRAERRRQEELRLEEQAQQTAATAMERFRGAHTQSLQAVIDATRQANDALIAMHRDTLSSAQIWGQGMSAVGNEVAGAIGGNLTSALSSSLDAWMSGSKSFGEAALDMARAVTKSLTMQGIIKAITETAEGLGALALTWGVPNPASLLHFAAAGTWAAIAGVSGAIGAGIGAFGGGGAQGAGAGRAAGGRGMLAPQAANNNGGVTNIFINVPPSLMTNAERGQFIGNSLQAARRQGLRVAA